MAGNDEAASVAALTSLYAADRADLSALSAMTTNILAMALAYIAATVAFLSGDTAARIGPWVLVSVPLPVVLLTCYWLTLVAAIAARSLSARRMERVLHTHLATGSVELSKIGLTATEPLFNVRVVPLVGKPVVIIPYLGAGMVVAGHVVVMLTRSWSLGGGLVAVIVAGVLYLSAAVSIGVAIAYYRRHLISLLDDQASAHA